MERLIVYPERVVGNDRPIIAPEPSIVRLEVELKLRVPTTLTGPLRVKV